MTINARRNGAFLTLGKWSCHPTDEVFEGMLPADFAELYGGTLYGFIGLELHAQQQGQSTLYYKYQQVRVMRMEDTAGTVEESTMLEIGEDRDTFTLGELDKDEQVNWEETR